MNVVVDGVGNVTVHCGWTDFDDDVPDTEETKHIVAIERHTDRYVICTFMEEWRDINTLEKVDIKYWMHIPDYPEYED